MTHKPQPRNLLADQSSPYLLQHAANPVHWRPWGEAALTEAQQRDCPILLSIGYAACHWCHVMAHQSFENNEIAALMNRLFVNVKVDREERPDIDQIYMAALHAMGEQGGWPLTMFLSPDGRPFWGGTYFPPQPAHGRPGFAQLLLAIDKAWREDRDAITRNAAALQKHLAGQSGPPDSAAPPQPAILDAFASAVLSISDPANGGIRGAPKFPNAPITEIWLRAARAEPASEPARIFLHAIERMSQGGIYDHLGGGLARYSVDDKWLVPHFEKMLYDNAHYLRALLWAWQLDPRPLFRQRIEETIAWLDREMKLPTGAYASSLDADSEGHEGKFYVWTADEIQKALGTDGEFFCQAYGVTSSGNFDGTNVLNRLDTPVMPPTDESRLAACRQTLFAIRDRRIRPALDDKILADWNGYAIRALAEAGFVLNRPEWIARAAASFRFICESMCQDNALSHSWRQGIHVRPALLTDYGAMMNAAVSLHGATADERYLDHARAWLQILDRDHSDGRDGYYLTSASAGDLITRPRADLDDPNPSGSAQVLEAVSRLAHLSGEPAMLDRAWALAANLHAALANSAYGTAGFHCAFDTLVNGRTITIVEDTGNTVQWLDVMRRYADPALLWKTMPEEEAVSHFGSPVGFARHTSAAIVCSRQSCTQPLTAPPALARALKARA